MPLEKRQLDELRSLIQTQLSENAEITQQVDAAAQTVELDQNRVGRLSRMDAMQGQAMAQASSRRRAQLAIALQESLSRLDDQDFGHCDECGELIPFGRLQIDPCVRMCVLCAKTQERV